MLLWKQLWPETVFHLTTHMVVFNISSLFYILKKFNNALVSQYIGSNPGNIRLVSLDADLN